MSFVSKDPKYEAKKDHYKKNKKLWVERRHKRRKENKQWIRKFLSNNPCKCGESRVAALEFHHRNREKKKIGISKAAQDWSLDRIKNEINKCDVLCRNCHRKKHWDEIKQYGKDRSSIRRYKLRNWYRFEILSNYKCLKCNERDIRVLDFHHRSTETKLFTVSLGVARLRSKKEILEEIDKCDPLCANCHGVAQNTWG